MLTSKSGGVCVFSSDGFVGFKSAGVLPGSTSSSVSYSVSLLSLILSIMESFPSSWGIADASSLSLILNVLIFT